MVVSLSGIEREKETVSLFHTFESAISCVKSFTTKADFGLRGRGNWKNVVIGIINEAQISHNNRYAMQRLGYLFPEETELDIQTVNGVKVRAH